MVGVSRTIRRTITVITTRGRGIHARITDIMIRGIVRIITEAIITEVIITRIITTVRTIVTRRTVQG